MMAKTDPSERDTPAVAAASIANFTAELAIIARRNGLDTLGYLLEMARLEAENLARPPTRRG
jgi:hypothetical protein